jgi:hypothetical protein
MASDVVKPSSFPEDRRAYAWTRLSVWVPRSKVVAELMSKFGISQNQAYMDVRGLYQQLAEQRRMSRAAEAAALLEQIDEETERLRDATTEFGRAPVTTALSRLWDMKARLTGAYRDTTKIAVLVATAKEATGLSDEELERAISGAQEQLALPAPVDAFDVQAHEVPGPVPAEVAPPPVEPPAAPPRRQRRGRGRSAPDA